MSTPTEPPPPTGSDAPTQPQEPVETPTAAEPAAPTRPPAEPVETPTAAEPEAPASAPGRAPWSRTRFWVIGGAVLLVCLLIVALGIALARGDRDDPGAADPGNADPGNADPAAEDHTVSGAIEGREEAALHLVSGSNVVTVRTEAMGDTLYRVSTPPDGDAVPQVVDQDDRIEVHLAPTGEPGPSSVEIVLSTEVRWSLRFSGGANEQLMDLTGGRFAEIDFAAGAARIELTLPVPDRIVPVRVGSGAGELVMEVPAEVPVRATLHSGAGRVIFEGESHAGIDQGSEFTTADWEQAEQGYDLDSAGVGELVVTRTGA